MAKIGSLKVYIVIGVLLVIFLPPFIRYQELRYKNNKMGARIRALKKEVKRLEGEKLRLESDITYIEKKAREKMGVVRKGEIVIKETPAKQRNN